ncbi:MAG: hydantoinase B/oxoprolinase family protein [Pseudomonadota bacterium]
MAEFQANPSDIRVHVASHGGTAEQDIDPVIVEIVRHSLDSAANQMKRTLIRTSVSPLIYEVLDFAAAIYDKDLRMLSQAPSLPLFMGTLDFCIDAAVKGIGGTDNLKPGDVLLYNWPYGTGSHAQDSALIQPAFSTNGELLGYAAIKAHWLDIGAYAPYCTDTTDVYQEGTFFPGVKLFSEGKVVDDIYRCVLANSRMPHIIEGDIRAQATAVGVGVSELERVYARFGAEVFPSAVEKIFDHGEAIVKSYFEQIPDGTYVGCGVMDNNGVTQDKLPFEATLIVDGDSVTVDFTKSPDEQSGPVNCPLPSTISASRVAVAMLAGKNESPNEGHFRAITVKTRRGSMFDPKPPAPCFLYGWPAMQAIEAIYHAVSKVDEAAVPACSGGDICALVWWGVRKESGEMWGDGSPFPVGHGGHVHGDGCTMMHIAESATQFAPIEVMESKFPWMVKVLEFMTDSCGAGEHRGGLGYAISFHVLEDCFVTSSVERTLTDPWSIAGGSEGVPNRMEVQNPDGSVETIGKVTGREMLEGSTLTIYTGGGGGYGDPKRRDIEAVRRDYEDGVISKGHVTKYYPHAAGVLESTAQVAAE